MPVKEFEQNVCVKCEKQKFTVLHIHISDHITCVIITFHFHHVYIIYQMDPQKECA